MNNTRLQIPARGCLGNRSRGVTLVETVLSLAILGGAFVAALNTIASARGSQMIVAQRRMGMVLAQDLIDEILSQVNYEEGSTIGLDSGEGGNRSTFDDIDDYHNWSNTPVDIHGNEVSGTSGYARQVQVDYVDPADQDTVINTDRGLKRITVTVTYESRTVAEIYSYRSRVWQSPQETY